MPRCGEDGQQLLCTYLIGVDKTCMPTYWETFEGLFTVSLI